MAANDVRPPLAALYVAASVGCPSACDVIGSLYGLPDPQYIRTNWVHLSRSLYNFFATAVQSRFENLNFTNENFPRNSCVTDEFSKPAVTNSQYACSNAVLKFEWVHIKDSNYKARIKYTGQKMQKWTVITWLYPSHWFCVGFG